VVSFLKKVCKKRIKTATKKIDQSSNKPLTSLPRSLKKDAIVTIETSRLCYRNKLLGEDFQVLSLRISRDKPTRQKEREERRVCVYEQLLREVLIKRSSHTPHHHLFLEKTCWQIKI
jgi:hypothetical protein